MTYSECKRLIKMDAERYSDNSVFRLYFKEKLFRLTFRYRLIKLMMDKFFLKPIGYFERMLYKRSCTKYGVDIPWRVSIGGGWRIVHPWGITVNSHCKIGTGFTILTGSVVGATPNGYPIIGDNVLCGAHSLILGNITVGNNVDIGAGAIVVHDVPDNAVVVCESARIIKYKK